MSYAIVPGGTFESGTSGWKLNGASVSSGNEPWKVHGEGSKSLKIERGESATTPVMCAGLEHPTMRFFAKSTSGLLGTLTSSLRVDVIFETSVGLQVSA